MDQTPGLLERLMPGVILSVEGYVFELEQRCYVMAGVPEVLLDDPVALSELNLEFMRASAEVMVAFPYYGDRERLKVVGIECDVKA